MAGDLPQPVFENPAEERTESGYLKLSWEWPGEAGSAEFELQQSAGIDFSERAKAAIKSTSQKNVQNRYGKHRYNLADFNLTPEQIEQTYAYYRHQYGIPHE